MLSAYQARERDIFVIRVRVGCWSIASLFTGFLCELIKLPPSEIYVLEVPSDRDVPSEGAMLTGSSIMQEFTSVAEAAITGFFKAKG